MMMVVMVIGGEGHPPPERSWRAPKFTSNPLPSRLAPSSPLFPPSPFPTNPPLPHTQTHPQRTTPGGFLFPPQKKHPLLSSKASMPPGGPGPGGLFNRYLQLHRNPTRKTHTSPTTDINFPGEKRIPLSPKEVTETKTRKRRGMVFFSLFVMRCGQCTTPNPHHQKSTAPQRPGSGFCFLRKTSIPRNPDSIQLDPLELFYHRRLPCPPGGRAGGLFNR